MVSKIISYCEKKLDIVKFEPDNFCLVLYQPFYYKDSDNITEIKQKGGGCPVKYFSRVFSLLNLFLKNENISRINLFGLNKFESKVLEGIVNDLNKKLKNEVVFVKT